MFVHVFKYGIHTKIDYLKTFWETLTTYTYAYVQYPVLNTIVYSVVVVISSRMFVYEERYFCEFLQWFVTLTNIPTY